MPADVVSSFIAAIERNDLDHALSHLTDDCEYHNIPLDPVVGRDAVRGVLQPFMANYDEVQWLVLHQVESGTLDHGVVFNERVDRFRSGDRWLDLPVAGVFVVRHGQIAEWRDYFDLATLTRQATG